MRVPKPLSLTLALVLGAGVLPATVSMTATAAPPEDDSGFTALRGFEPRGADVRVKPRAYAASRVDLPALRADLAKSGSGSTVVSIPDPSGRSVDFRVEQTRLMEDGLATKHPEITTYAGRGVDDSVSTIALDLTPMGFHASVRGANGQRAWYVDPAYNRRGTTAHLSYYNAALPPEAQRRAEGEIRSIRSAVEAEQAAQAAAGQPVTKRFYRLALTSDPTYAAYFGVENVLSEKVTLINRVNQIYNEDMAINLRLINETDKLNLDTVEEASGPDGLCGSAPCFAPYDDGGTPGDDSDDIPGDLDFCDAPVLNKNRNFLGLVIGAENYDVGHIALGVDGGGVAYLGVVGGAYKGSGCTGLEEPTGDFFAVDYVAHELGHQFGGNHTFNGATGNNCLFQREPGASVEPGSGSSVMAYAGICRQDNLQPHSDPYLSHHTIDEFTALSTGAPYGNVEVQSVSLRGFDADGDSFELGYPGQAPVTITRGGNYTAADLAAAITGLTGQDASVAQWAFDEYGYPLPGDDPDGPQLPHEPGDEGFSVFFNTVPSIESESPDMESLTVTAGTGGVTGLVGEVDKGGPSGNQGTPVTSANTAPTVTAQADRTIPMRTPFALTAAASDADGNPVTYSWEQHDYGAAAGGNALTSNGKVYGPLFRMFGTAVDISDEDALKSPSPGQHQTDGDPTRVFPDLAQILANNTNAVTGNCEGVVPTPNTVPLSKQMRECFSEYLPKAGYLGSAPTTSDPAPAAGAMHFRVTARDGDPIAGGTSYDDVTLALDPNAGPFLVTSQSAAGQTVTGGVPVPITWDVKGTQALAANVKITLSTDGGKTFGKVLSASTPNDGSERLKLPNEAAAKARIKIEAVDNYFFDLNDADFAIGKRGAPDTTFEKGPKKGIVLAKKATLRFGSDAEDAEFDCTVDGKDVACPGGVVKVKARTGTHRVTATARTEAGSDASPVVRSYTVPVNDTKLKASGSWRRLEDRSAFRGDVSLSSDAGSALALEVSKARRIVLVVSTGKAGGEVEVLLGKRLLRTVSTQGKNKTKVLKSVKVKGKRSGLLKIRVEGRKPVRIEGVAVVR